jgi:GGDEF domain-containing protein
MAPLEESAHRLLMRLLSITGRRGAALQQYQICKSMLARELGIEPAAETVQLYEQIKMGMTIDTPDTGKLNPAHASNQPTRPHSRPTGPLYDPFTQIPLRTLFMDRLTHAITRMERDHFYAVVACLNTTVPLNMDLSPETRVQVEQNLIRRLVGSIRKGDSVGRLKDDEYGILLESIHDPDSIPPLIEKLARTLSDPFTIHGQRITFKVAIGVGIYPTDGTDPVALLAHADTAMRAARLQQSTFFFLPDKQ